MGRRRTIPVTTVGQFWDALTADYGVAGTYAFAVEEIQTRIPGKLNFFDEFNRTAEDTDVWTSGGDDGSFTEEIAPGEATIWRIATGGVIDNDRYIHGDTVMDNKGFTPNEYGYTTVTWEARLRLAAAVNISAFWGLLGAVQTDYVEFVGECAHFLADPVVSNTFRARSYQAAEEETDTLVALDNAYHVFRMVWTNASVLFYIDDVLVATHAAQVPTYRLHQELLVRTEAAAATYMYVDYVHVEVT